ncbi:MAG TPA: hypothetical protein VHT93_19235 [Pseudolabrys sp.]|nr:hypothetical protein [Pseudolabrys sp.]
MIIRTPFSAAATPERPAHFGRRLTPVSRINAMWKFGIVLATALSLASAVATPAFAARFSGIRGGDAMALASGGPRVTQASTGSVVSAADAAYCRQRWAAYDSTTGKYMDDEGEWRPCR